MDWQLLLVAALVLYIYAAYVEPRWFRIRKRTLKTRKKLSKPIRILHLSDTHFTESNPRHKKLFSKLNTLNPDFIFITGDIIDHDAGASEAARILGDLEMKVGTYAILGNHDYYDYEFIDNFRYHLKGIRTSKRANNAHALKQKLEERGIHVLVNDCRQVDVNGMSVVIGGTDDPITQKVDFDRALSGMKPDSLNLLLTHIVDSVLSIKNEQKSNDLDFVFAGHTHGGQFRIPFIGGYVYGFKMAFHYVDGIHRWKNAYTCVSRGLNASRTLTHRFCCRPEVIVVDIVPDSST